MPLKQHELDRLDGLHYPIDECSRADHVMPLSAATGQGEGMEAWFVARFGKTFAEHEAEMNAAHFGCFAKRLVQYLEDLTSGDET